MKPARERSRPGPAKADVPTIQDVARIAGVSAATVSRAFARPRAVAASTRARVAAAAREIGYEPQAARPAETNIVLVLVPHLGSSFFTPALDAASDILSEAGYCVTIGDLRGSRQKERHYARALGEGRFVGAILFTGSVPRDGATEPEQPLNIPLVLACNDIATRPDLSLFDVDDRKAAAKIVTYLIQLGHRRIAHIRGPEDNIEARERFEGYKQALHLAKLQLEKDLVWDGDYFVGSGIAAAGRYLASAARPTAVFAGNDQMAMGFVTEIKAAGFSVPGDVSVAGFDDVEFASLLDPPLTTMRQPREEIGRLAALELLHEMREGSTRPARRLRLECELTIRSSTQALRIAIERKKSGAKPARSPRGQPRRAASADN